MNPFQQALTQLRHRQQLLAVLIFSLVAIMVWVAVSLITSQKSSSISAELRTMAQPLTPSLNRDTLQKIEDRSYVPEEELKSFPILKVIDKPPENSPEPSPSETPSPSEVPSPSPELNNPLVSPEQPSPVSSPVSSPTTP